MTDTSQPDTTSQERKMSTVNPHTPLHDELRTRPLVDKLDTEDLERMLVWPKPFLSAETNNNGGYSLSDLHLGPPLSQVRLPKRKPIESPFGVGRFASDGLGLIGDFHNIARTPHTVDMDVDQQWEIVRNPFGDGEDLFLGAVLHVLSTETSGGFVGYSYALTLADVLAAVNFAERRDEQHLGEMLTGLPAEMRKSFLESVTSALKRKKRLRELEEKAARATKERHRESYNRGELAVREAQKRAIAASAAVGLLSRVSLSLVKQQQPQPQRTFAEPQRDRSASVILFRGQDKAGKEKSFSVPCRLGHGAEVEFPYLLVSDIGAKYPHFEWAGWGSVLDRIAAEFGGLENVSKVEAL